VKVGIVEEERVGGGSVGVEIDDEDTRAVPGEVDVEGVCRMRESVRKGAGVLWIERNERRCRRKHARVRRRTAL
jgi:hypothetical protein